MDKYITYGWAHTWQKETGGHTYKYIDEHKHGRSMWVDTYTQDDGGVQTEQKDVGEYIHTRW
jgi:hypothetical protein